MVKAIKIAKEKRAKAFARRIVLRYASLCIGVWKDCVLWKLKLKKLARRVMMSNKFIYFEMFCNQVEISIDNRLYPFARIIQSNVRGFMIRLKQARAHKNLIRKRLLENGLAGETLSKIQKWWRGISSVLYVFPYR